MGNAVLATSANLLTGTKYFDQVTNTYAGYFTSSGSASSITLPWQADKFEWYRYTGYGTAGIIASGVWFYDMPDGAELETKAIVDNGVTGNLNTVLDTTNGITIANVAPSFTNEHKTITGITAATPGVVTITAHGYTSGQRVIITKVVGSIGASVNNQTFVVNVLTANTFALYDIYGLPVQTVGTYTSGGQCTLTGPDLNIQMSDPVYKLTLGTAVMGSANDVIYFVVTRFNSFYNLGTL